MCLGTFSRLRRSLATSTLYAAVRILAERFLLYSKAISCKVKNSKINFLLFERAIDGARTRGLDLGKVARYQLRHYRICYVCELSCVEHVLYNTR